jgi:hypothetical protein
VFSLVPGLLDDADGDVAEVSEEALVACTMRPRVS